MEDVLHRLATLLSIKSIITLALTVLYSVMVMRGKISSEQLNALYTMIIGFYFGMKWERESKK